MYPAQSISASATRLPIIFNAASTCSSPPSISTNPNPKQSLLTLTLLNYANLPNPTCMPHTPPHVCLTLTLTLLKYANLPNPNSLHPRNRRARLGFSGRREYTPKQSDMVDTSYAENLERNPVLALTITLTLV